MTSKSKSKNINLAIAEYILCNSTFESNEAIRNSIQKINQATSIEDIFKIPIDDRLFNFTNSLQWLYFICFLIGHFPSNTGFSTDAAIVYISNKYDAANETFYHDYLYESDSDDD